MNMRQKLTAALHLKYSETTNLFTGLHTNADMTPLNLKSTKLPYPAALAEKKNLMTAANLRDREC